MYGIYRPIVRFILLVCMAYDDVGFALFQNGMRKRDENSIDSGQTRFVRSEIFDGPLAPICHLAFPFPRPSSNLVDCMA